MDASSVVIALLIVATLCFGSGVATIIAFQRSARRDAVEYLVRVAPPQPNAYALVESERRARDANAAARQRRNYDFGTTATTSNSTDDSLF